MSIINALILLLVANGSPVIIRNLLGEQRFSLALDHGRHFFDDRPVFGPHKTYRGLLASVVTTTITAWLLSLPLLLGVLFSLLSMLGDLFASFCKRRMHIHSGGMALGLDQLPEALLPLLLLKSQLQLSYTDVAISLVLFVILDLLLSSLLFKLQIRKHPY